MELCRCKACQARNQHQAIFGSHPPTPEEIAQCTRITSHPRPGSGPSPAWGRATPRLGPAQPGPPSRARVAQHGPAQLTTSLPPTQVLCPPLVTQASPPHHLRCLFTLSRTVRGSPPRSHPYGSSHHTHRRTPWRPRPARESTMTRITHDAYGLVRLTPGPRLLPLNGPGTGLGYTTRPLRPTRSSSHHSTARTEPRPRACTASPAYPARLRCHSARLKTHRLHARLGSYDFTQSALKRSGLILGSAHIFALLDFVPWGCSAVSAGAKGGGGLQHAAGATPTISVGGNGPASARAPGFYHRAGHVRRT
jgi:hypothetical protein